MNGLITAAIPMLVSGIVFSIIGMGQAGSTFVTLGGAMASVGTVLLILGMGRHRQKNSVRMKAKARSQSW